MTRIYSNGDYASRMHALIYRRYLARMQVVGMAVASRGNTFDLFRCEVR